MSEAKANASAKKDVSKEVKQALEIGNGVKWSFADEDGKGSHTGKVIGLNEKYVVFVTKFGCMTVRLTDGTFEVCQIADASLDNSVISEMPKSTASSARSGSKLERAIALAKAHPNATRAQLKEMFIKQLEMTAAGAQTYVYNVQKALKEEKGTSAVKEDKKEKEVKTEAKAEVKEKDEKKEAAPSKEKEPEKATKPAEAKDGKDHKAPSAAAAK